MKKPATLVAGFFVWRTPCFRIYGLIGGCLGGLLLAACTRVGIYTAATGTMEEAREVVRLIYGQGSAEEINALPTEGNDLTRVMQRWHDRDPGLQPLFA